MTDAPVPGLPAPEDRELMDEAEQEVRALLTRRLLPELSDIALEMVLAEYDRRGARIAELERDLAERSKPAVTYTGNEWGMS